MADDIVERLRALLVRIDPNGDDPCEHCGGYGEWFGHAPGCDNDSCALAGGIDDCDGAVEPCQCRIALEQEAVEALPALLAEIERLRTLLAEETEACARADDGWQDISTAPKDGTWVLGWAERDSSPYRISWGRNHNNRLAWCTAFGSFVDGYITHWMPLTPPQSVRERG